MTRVGVRVRLLAITSGVALVAVAAVAVVNRLTSAAPAVPTVAAENRGTVPAFTTEPSTTSTAVEATPSTGESSRSASRIAPMEAAGARLTISRLGIDAPIVAVTSTHQVLDVPLDPRVLGWWTGGASPGSRTGSVVIDGHINYNGVSGALSVLPDMRPGDTVSVHHGQQRLTYRVQAVKVYPKAAGLPTDLFSSTGPERLELITCGGQFDAHTGNYEDNIVAYATPVG
ncbi:MAG: class F sortase [Actinomycetota bacterium]|nr:class F sortase [Actinomycetota bacterium]